MKRLRKILLGIVGTILLIIVGLILNNRFYYWRYCQQDTAAGHLSDSEIKSAEQVYTSLKKERLFEGLGDEKTDLILYNEAYEFLFSSEEEKGEWTYLEDVPSIERKLYRRKAQETQAFATKIGDRWAGSFCTHTYYNKSILEQVPMFIPPQLLTADEDYYEAIVIHEMIHALEGNWDDERVEKDQHLHHINARFEGNAAFNQGIKQEAEKLEEALKSTKQEESMELAREFLKLRAERRKSCGMTPEEITIEKEVEWLEGTGRYAEYHFSRNSKSLIAKNLDQITQKTQNEADDRYYTLGMAQELLLDKLKIDWQEKLFKEGMTIEDCLAQNIQ